MSISTSTKIQHAPGQFMIYQYSIYINIKAFTASLRQQRLFLSHCLFRVVSERSCDSANEKENLLGAVSIYLWFLLPGENTDQLTKPETVTKSRKIESIRRYIRRKKNKKWLKSIFHMSISEWNRNPHIKINTNVVSWRKHSLILLTCGEFRLGANSQTVIKI